MTRSNINKKVIGTVHPVALTHAHKPLSGSVCVGVSFLIIGSLRRTRNTEVSEA